MFAESEDEEQIIERVAALDIGKAEVVCCVRLPAPGRGQAPGAGGEHPLDDGGLAGGVGQPAGAAAGRAGRDGGNQRLRAT